MKLHFPKTNFISNLCFQLIWLTWCFNLDFAEAPIFPLGSHQNLVSRKGWEKYGRHVCLHYEWLHAPWGLPTSCFQATARTPGGPTLVIQHIPGCNHLLRSPGFSPPLNPWKVLFSLVTTKAISLLLFCGFRFSQKIGNSLTSDLLSTPTLQKPQSQENT